MEIHRHQQLRADPTGLGQPPALQGPPGQLGQRIRRPLPTSAGILGVGRAGQRRQRRQQRLAGFGFQQPIDGDHALPGG